MRKYSISKSIKMLRNMTSVVIKVVNLVIDKSEEKSHGKKYQANINNNAQTLLVTRTLFLIRLCVLLGQ